MTLLKRHHAAKTTILAELVRIADIAEDVGMKTLATDIRTTRIPKLEAEQFFLVVLGEFNHGKSTFVNALLGDDVLPTGITPTTAAINHVVHGDKPTAVAHLSDGSTKKLPVNKLAEWVTVSGENIDDVTFVELTHPSEILRNNVTLVDTPGVNDLNEQRADITYGYVPRADAVLFLLDAGQALKESEREFLSGHVLEGSRDRLIFVLCKIDMLSDSDREAVLIYCREHLAKFVDDPQVFPVSAKKWLDGDREASRMDPLLAHLTQFLDTDRAQVLLDNAAAESHRVAAYLERNLRVRQHALDLDVGELERRVGDVRSQLHATKKTLDELYARIRSETDAYKAQVRLDLEGFSRHFAEIIPGEIDRVDAADVKEYLGSFVEDKLKEWVELEGTKVATLLERLADDVIAVTNENVEQASKALASRLNPADAEVEISVDALKYELGVYAMGALGTVVFFVNSLAGGLLALATPILSIALRSKVAGDIKEQAKELVPDAIFKAADSMGPHFDACINDFATRLSEFVSGAGNTLYTGISEILDQTITERKKLEEDVGPLRDSTAKLIASVASSKSTLADVRAKVWLVPDLAEQQPAQEPQQDD